MVLPGWFPENNSTNMSFFTRFFFSERKAEREYDETLTRFQAEFAAAATPEEIIQKIREAIEYLVGKFWSGDRPRWIKIITTLGEFAGIIYQVIRALLTVFKKPAQ